MTSKQITGVLDPGHGLPDPGAIGVTGLQEHDVALLMAHLLKYKLEREKHRILLTRYSPDRSDPNRNKDFQARVDLANREKAAYFVSVHCNAAGVDTARGIETFHHPSSKLGIPLAKSIQEEMVKATGFRDRGAKYHANLFVLNRTHMPAVLVELPFLTTPEEEAALKRVEVLLQFAEGISAGIKKWIEEHKITAR